MLPPTLLYPIPKQSHPRLESKERNTSMAANLLERKETAFVLWRVNNTTEPPTLIIGQLQNGTPIRVTKQQHFALHSVSGFPHLFEIPVADCHFTDGQV